MSWLKKSVKKLGKSTKKIVKKAVRNPLAIVNPQTYFSGASLGGSAGAAAGKSASTGADLGGSAAVIGGGALATAGLVGGSELGTVADSGKSFFGDAITLPRTADGGIDFGALLKFGGGVAKDWGLGGMGGVDAAASAQAADSYSGAGVAADDAGELDQRQLLIYAGIGLAAVVGLVVLVKAAR